MCPHMSGPVIVYLFSYSHRSFFFSLLLDELHHSQDISNAILIISWSLLTKVEPACKDVA